MTVISTVQVPEMGSYSVEVIDHYDTATVTVYCCIWLDDGAENRDAFLLLHNVGSDSWSITNGQQVTVTFAQKD